MRHYILTPAYALRGWKLLPYAIQYLFAPRTEFFREDDWALFSACDGRTNIDWDALNDEQRGKYEHWEKGGFIRRAGDGFMWAQYVRSYYNPRQGLEN